MLAIFLNWLIWFGFGPSNQNIIIGDSQAPTIAYYSKLTVVEKSLQKGGWRVSNLIEALKVYSVNKNTKNVFVCIGTNGVFSKDDDVDALCLLLKEKFPSASIYVIPGSYGWSWKGPYTPPTSMKDKIKTYYNRFEVNGVHKLKNEIGLSSEHPNINTPSMKLIGAEIDSIITNK
jgi:hypothetical protein